MAFLRIMTGALKGQKFVVDRDEITIGRAPDNVVCLDDPSISGKHCSITRQGRRYTVTDLGSTNGTRLNGIRISGYRLSAKDSLSAGSIDMLFDGDDIEDDRATDIPPTIVKSAPQAEEAATGEVPSGVPAFAQKRSSKGIWTAIGAVVALLAVAAMIWFLRSLFV